MSGINCKCGNYFSTGSYPNSYGAFVISESRFDSVEAETINKEQFYKLFGTDSERMYKCPYCSRLVLSSIKSENGWDFYKLEKD